VQIARAAVVATVRTRRENIFALSDHRERDAQLLTKADAGPLSRLVGHFIVPFAHS